MRFGGNGKVAESGGLLIVVSVALVFFAVYVLELFDAPGLDPRGN